MQKIRLELEFDTIGELVAFCTQYGVEQKESADGIIFDLTPAKLHPSSPAYPHHKKPVNGVPTKEDRQRAMDALCELNGDDLPPADCDTITRNDVGRDDIADEEIEGDNPEDAKEMEDTQDSGVDEVQYEGTHLEDADKKIQIVTSLADIDIDQISSPLPLNTRSIIT